MGAAASTRAVGFKEPKPWRKKGTDEGERQRIYPLRSFLLCRCDAICEMEQACCNDERQRRCLRPPIEPSKQIAMPVADPFVLSVCIYAFRRLLCPMQPDQFFASRKTRIRCQEAPTLRWHGDGVFVVSCVCVCLDLLVRPTSRCLCSPMYRGKMRGAHAHTHTRTHAHTPPPPPTHIPPRDPPRTHTQGGWRIDPPRLGCRIQVTDLHARTSTWVFACQICGTLQCSSSVAVVIRYLQGAHSRRSERGRGQHKTQQ